MVPSTNDANGKRRLVPYTYLGCPLTRNRSAWCFRLCRPDETGTGTCGRTAPHAMKSRLQSSIERHNRKLQEANCRKLERLYRTSPANHSVGGQPAVSPGEAEIVFGVEPALSDSAGQVDCGVCLKALGDAARLAVNSLVDDALVTMVSFTSYVHRPLTAGRWIARGRFLATSEEQYLAEAVLTDADGLEFARGHGAFQTANVAFPAGTG